ncbi:type II toxin-antitoxin system RelE family toxin [Desulfolutivibrio sp.]|uniref:type II toxin-antitoxin system RelE family toxin n=1 Tax=Desulfolutivibrio sp. TaxID=2773296 RepID=UPI002F9629BC
MKWTVTFTRKAAKQAKKLPGLIAKRLEALLLDIQETGPIHPDRPRFGKLKNRPGEVYHCHLNKGRPVYVVVWEIEKNSIRVVEVVYVGTHENAPY